MDSKLNHFLNLLGNLSPDTKSLWGKMTSQHMVEHLILSVQMGNGKLKVECFNPVEKQPSLKRFLMSERPLPKLFINPLIGPDLLPLKFKSLSEAIEILKKEIEDYEVYFERNPDAKPVNATFGELNKQEWDWFHQKHFTHHLSQFGLIASGK
ncbi:MAG TPA: hypothetical protein VH917_03820 [Ignavibacteriaceae bacterium]